VEEGLCHEAPRRAFGGLAGTAHFAIAWVASGRTARRPIVELASESARFYAPRTLGALRSSLTYSRFFVAGDIPDDISGASMKRIRSTAFRDLVPEEDDASRHGWCSLQDTMDVDLDHEKVFFNEYLCLGLRIDSWIVPKPLLTAHLRQAEAALLERKGLERIGKKAKAELKLMVLRKLRRQLVPSTKSIDLVWNTRTHVARFFSQSPRIHLLVQELFEKTFGLRLVPESPGTAADRRGMDERASKRWDNLEPTTLATVEGAS
jgi:recombination associated protein RdgC